MNHIPNEKPLKMNFIEITPDNGNGFKSKSMEALPILKTGTTTVACKIKDGVIMATDNRATMGYFVANKNAKKLHRIQDYLWMTIAGGVADAIYLIDLLKAETEIYNLKNDKPIGIGQSATLLQNILYNKKGFYQVGHLLGGVTDTEGPKIFNLGGYGSLLDDDYASVGSGSVFAMGILETEWKEDMTLEEGMEVCTRAVRSAIIRDMASGNGIDLVAIQKGKKTVEKRYEISDQDLIELKLKNNK
ncbi:MAG: proteasome subunit beta [Promethearchaeota archaeon]